MPKICHFSSNIASNIAKFGWKFRIKSPILFNKVLKIGVSLFFRDRLQILLLIISEFKRIH